MGTFQAGKSEVQEPISRSWIGAALFCVMLVGYTLRFHLPVAEVLRDAAGGAAYVIAVGLVLVMIWPCSSLLAVTMAAFAVTCGVEVSQSISHPWLDDMRATRLGRLALGTTFSWGDFVAYVAGALIAFALLRLLPRRASLPTSTRTYS